MKFLKRQIHQNNDGYFFNIEHYYKNLYYTRTGQNIQQHTICHNQCRKIKPEHTIKMN